MKKLLKFLMIPALAVWAVIYSILCVIIVVIGMIFNLLHGISPKTTYESLKYHFNLDEEEPN